MPSPPKILRRRTVATSRLFRVEQLDLRFANGNEVTFERLGGTTDGAVIVAAVDADGQVLLVREYAAGLERYELGLPKGLIEAGETPERAALRELREETGHGARRLEALQMLTLAPAYMKHGTRLVLAMELYPDPLDGDEPEPPELVRWPLARLPELAERPDVTEARTLAALFLIREKLNA
ncbi:MAG: ADP compounds hydrolase NudE [Gammaproteobacteria bacterium]|nr:ADP compounds hydrolase NudE [Gammaproteobacteria bacterium]